MSEKRWLRGEDPAQLISDLLGRGSPRKLRLFGVACCRRVAHLMPDKAVLRAVGTAEKFADGLVTAEALRRASDRAWDVADRGAFPDDQRAESGAYHEAALAVWVLCMPDGKYDAHWLLDKVASAAVCDPDDPAEEDAHQAALLRDIFGNPFRPVAFDPAWRTTTARKLARQMYESRDFGPMPILADALEDAGCDSAEVLAHCRGDGPHVRGCWVVDLVLGKG